MSEPADPGIPSPAPTHCDACGASLWITEKTTHYVLQWLPAGETIDGRRYIAVCGSRACLDPEQVLS